MRVKILSKKDLKFNDVTHTYFYKGKEVAGVTTVLSDVGIADFSGVLTHNLEKAANRGTDIHLACDRFDRDGTIVKEDDAYPYVQQWVDFCDLFKPKWELIEEQVFCHKYLYAGTLDRLGRIGGRTVLVDIKTGAKSKSHPIQTAAYVMAYRGDRIKTDYQSLPEHLSFIKVERWCVYLTPKTFKVEEHSSIQDWDIFLSALNVYKYKKASK